MISVLQSHLCQNSMKSTLKAKKIIVILLQNEMQER